MRDKLLSDLTITCEYSMPIIDIRDSLHLWVQSPVTHSPSFFSSERSWIAPKECKLIFDVHTLIRRGASCTSICDDLIWLSYEISSSIRFLQPSRLWSPTLSHNAKIRLLCIGATWLFFLDLENNINCSCTVSSITEVFWAFLEETLICAYHVNIINSAWRYIP